LHISVKGAKNNQQKSDNNKQTVSINSKVFPIPRCNGLSDDVAQQETQILLFNQKSNANHSINPSVSQSVTNQPTNQ